MASPGKKPDPLNAKARALNDEIAALEAEIKKLDDQLHRAPAPKFRSTAMPFGATVLRIPEKPAPTAPAVEPVFEELKRSPLAPGAAQDIPEIFNELGVRKYDLPALWGRLRNHFRGPTPNNPRLVNYLAAGNVHGLRPMRYEKRVARNRFVLLVIVLILISLGIISMLVKTH